MPGNLNRPPRSTTSKKEEVVYKASASPETPKAETPLTDDEIQAFEEHSFPESHVEEVLDTLNRESFSQKARNERAYFQTGERRKKEVRAEEKAAEAFEARKKVELPGAVGKLQESARLKKESARLAQELEKESTRLTQEIADLRVRASINTSMKRGEGSKQLRAQADALEKELESLRKGKTPSSEEPARIESSMPETSAGEPYVEIEAPETVDQKTPENPEGTLVDSSAEASDADTRPEKIEKLRSVINQFDELAKNSGVDKERTAMKEAEAKYLESYKNYHKKRTFIDRIRGGEPKNLSQRKQEFDAARVAYAAALEASTAKIPKESATFEARVKKQYEEKLKDDSLEIDKDGKPISFNEYQGRAYAERQKRIASYVRFREVVRPLAQKKIDARKEALDAKGKNVFENSLSWVAEKNKKLEDIRLPNGKKLGKNGARAVRILATSILATGGAAAVGSFGTAGLIGAAGWGTMRFGRSMIGAFAGSAAGVAAGEIYEKAIGRGALNKARQQLKTTGRNTPFSFSSLRALDKTRETLTIRADEETLAKKKLLIQTLTALGIGAGTTAALTELSSLHNAADTLASHVTSKEMHDFAHPHPAGHGPGNGHQGHPLNGPKKEVPGAHPQGTSHPAETHPPAAKGPGSQSHAAPASPEAPKHSDESLTVDTKHINDGEKLMGHFAQKLQHDYGIKPESHDTPPAIEKLLAELHTKDGASLLKGEGHAAHDLGLEGKGLSTILHPGDKISFDHNQIVIDRPGHPELHHVLIDDKGSVHPLDATKWHQAAVHHATHHEAPKTDHAAPAKTETTPAAEASAAAAQPTPEVSSTTSATPAHATEATQAPDHSAAPAEATPAAAPVSESHPAPTPETTVAPATAPTATPEVPHTTPEVPTASDVIDGAPPQIEAMTHSEAWSDVKGLDSYKVLLTSPPPGNPVFDFREQMFSVMRESGVGPQPGESVQQYLTHASHEIQDHMDAGEAESSVHMGIYETPDHHLIVHGGDFSARQLLGREYIRIHPDAEVNVENIPGSAVPVFVLPKEIGDVNLFQPSSIKPIILTDGQQPIF